MSPAPKLSIIVPTWNNLEMLRLCLSSIRRHSTLSHQVVLHINDGSDGTLDWVRREGIDHTWTAHNIGICRAMNIAFERCRAEYIVYLNDDMYVLPGWEQPLLEHASAFGEHEPCYVSGTMIQANPISPVGLKADYGADPRTFRQDQLLEDFHAGRLTCSDWSGATWPPCCVHRRWWELVGGYDEELSSGFYSDIDFSMRLWQAGCRRFYGMGSSLVYHFGEVTTSRVRGPKSCRVRKARLQFLGKWGVLPTTFRKHFIRVNDPPAAILPESSLSGALVERARLSLVSALSGARRLRAAS